MARGRRAEAPARRPSGERIKDAIMMAILLIWLTYALAAVVQLFRSGAVVLDSLPPFWFWGIPLGPYGALYQPWQRGTSAVVTPPATPDTPADPR